MENHWIINIQRSFTTLIAEVHLCLLVCCCRNYFKYGKLTLFLGTHVVKHSIWREGFLFLFTWHLPATSGVSGMNLLAFEERAPTSHVLISPYYPSQASEWVTLHLPSAFWVQSHQSPFAGSTTSSQFDSVSISTTSAFSFNFPHCWLIQYGQTIKHSVGFPGIVCLLFS